jgi:two-component system response regulator PilR (NtrC family)
VRELENVVERAVALSRGGEIDVSVLPPTVVRTRARPAASGCPRRASRSRTCSPTTSAACLVEALEQCGGVKKRAAQRLGISFRSFRYRLEKLGLEEPDASDEESGAD